MITDSETGILARMRKPVNRSRAARLLLGLACLLPAAAAGEPGGGDESRLWFPALAVFGSALAPPTAKVLPPDASGAGRFDGPGATDAGQHWLPALAVIVPMTAADAANGTLVLTPVLVAVVEVATTAATPSGDRPATGETEILEREMLEPKTGEPQAKDETERWVPAFAVLSGVLLQNAEAAGQSNDTFTYQLTNRTLTGRRPDQVEVVTTEDVDGEIDWSGQGDDLMLGPFVGVSAELMTPGLASVAGRPRLFFHGGAAAYFGPERNLAREGAPGMVPETAAVLTPAVALPGQGIQTSVEVDRLLLSAGAGVAFTIDAWGRRLRIKPSFEYLREELEVSGLMAQAFKTDSGLGVIRRDPPPTSPGWTKRFRSSPSREATRRSSTASVPASSSSWTRRARVRSC